MNRRAVKQWLVNYGIPAFNLYKAQKENNMTGYESKRAAAQDKLIVTDIDGHVVRDARKPKNAQPAPVQEFGLTRERFNALEDEITTLQAEWQSALKEVVRLKAAQPALDKLEQAAFDAWWDTQPRLNETNPCSVDSFEYWAWEGWHAALAQPEQEPVAWYVKNNSEPLLGAEPSFYLEVVEEILAGQIEDSGSEIAPLYSHPQRPWVDLTDDEIWTLHDSYPNPVEFARAIEQLSKEKNL